MSQKKTTTTLSGGTLPLIGLIGYPRAGKDSVAARLRALGYSRRAIADAIREQTLRLDPRIAPHGKLSSIVSVIGWERAKDEIPGVREALQRVGQTAFESDAYYWIEKLRLEEAKTPVVVTDVRRREEAAYILGLGGELWWISRPGFGPVNDHPTEDLGPLQELCSTGIVNSGTLHELDFTVREVLGWK